MPVLIGLGVALAVISVYWHTIISVLLLLLFVGGAIAGMGFLIHWHMRENQEAKQRAIEHEEWSKKNTIEREIEDGRPRALLAIEKEIVAYVNAFVPAGSSLFNARVPQILPNQRELVMEVCSALTKNSRYIADIATIYNTNVETVSRTTLTHRDFDAGMRVGPREYKGDDVLEQYLKGTPYLGMLRNMRLPIGIPVDIRPEHCVIVGKTGAGKSQLLEKLIVQDLMQADPPGMLIIDSKTDNDTTDFRRMSLFNRISRLDVFNPIGGRLRDRLIIIDPSADKPALNMFDFRGELTSAKVNQIHASMRYFFGGLLGDDLSSQMDTLFLPLLHVILRVKGATLHDLQQLIRDPLKYPDVLDQLPPGIRRFLVEEFSPNNARQRDGYSNTKQALVTRIQGIINKESLDKMFSAPSNAIDVATELGNGAIILVSTNARDLQLDTVSFGRYWISQMHNAGMQKKTDRRIHFYCDETKPYVDEGLTNLLTTIRSYNVGVTLAFQGIWQMDTQERAILSSTDIKFLSRGEQGDANAFAPFYSGMDADTLMKVQSTDATGRFAMQHRKLAKSLVVEFPFGEVDKLPRMSEADYRHLRANNKRRVEGNTDGEAPSYTSNILPTPADGERFYEELQRQGGIVIRHWGQIEELIIEAGAWTWNTVTDEHGKTRRNKKIDIDKLLGPLEEHQVDDLHRLRQLRNGLSHRDPQLIEKVDSWEKAALMYKPILRNLKAHPDPTDASPLR